MKNELLSQLKNESYCYLTTTGRVTGNPHEIEIWFGLKETTLYLLSGNGRVGCYDVSNGTRQWTRSVSEFGGSYVHENATTDRPMSVFAADLPAGTYVFGAQDSGNNFYTIGVMPQ